MSFFVRGLSFVATAAIALGCGSTMYQPSRLAPLDHDSSAEINDDDVRKAFEAKPQLPGELRVAHFTYAPEKSDALDATLKTLPGVVGTYAIPSLMVTGARRFDQQPRGWDPQPQALSIKKLRLIAARARCDALVVLDYGYRVDGSANWFAVLNVALVPMLFTPWLDSKYVSYVDAYVVDTRNGYLYGHVSSEEERAIDYTTIYAKDGPVLDEQWTKLRAALGSSFQKLVESERAKAKTP